MLNKQWPQWCIQRCKKLIYIPHCEIMHHFFVKKKKKKNVTRFWFFFLNTMLKRRRKESRLLQCIYIYTFWSRERDWQSPFVRRDDHLDDLIHACMIYNYFIVAAHWLCHSYILYMSLFVTLTCTCARILTDL